MLKKTQNHTNLSLKKSWLKNLSVLRHNSQTGQTFPISTALGFLGISAGLLTLFNAGNEKQNIIAQEGANKAQNITEAGIAKSLTTFSQDHNQYLLLASYGGNSWTAPTSSDLDQDGDNIYTDDIQINNANGCSTINSITKLDTRPDAKTFIEDIVFNNTLIADIETGAVGSGSSAGTYRVNSYQYDKANNQGILQIQGQNSNNIENKAQYQVTFAVNTDNTPPTGSTTGNAAAIVGENINSRGTGIFANTIICADPLTTGNCGNQVVINNSYCADGVLTYDQEKNYSSLTTSELAEYQMLETLLGSTSNGFKAPDNKQVSNIVINSTIIPAITTAPVGATILTFDASTGSEIDLSQPAFSSSFVEETVNGDIYHAIYIQLNNIASRAGDLNVVINETGLESITVNGNNIDTEKMLVRLYIGENMVFDGNDAIQVYNSSNNRITGATEKERNQIASLRIIGGNADGTPVGNLTWDMSETSCLMGHIHAPTASLSLPDADQTSGCDNTDGEIAISLNTIAQNDYGAANVNSIGSTIATPHVFGAIWAKSISASDNDPLSFYENTALTQVLAAEFGANYPGITGTGEASTSVKIGSGITSIVRQAVQ